MIVCGYSSVADNWPPMKVRSIFTSPPYCNGTNYGETENGNPIDDKNLSSWNIIMHETFRRAWENSTPDSMLWLQVKADERGFQALEIAHKNGWFRRNTFGWIYSATLGEKDNPEDPEFSFGHYRPIVSNMKVHGGFEIVFQMVKRPSIEVSYEDCFDKFKNRPFPEEGALHPLSIGVPYSDKSNLKRFTKKNNGEEKPDLRSRGNVLYVPYQTKNETNHPCPFPPLLPEMCLRLQGIKPGDMVIDPFCGEGNTGVAATRLGAEFWGIDVSPKWCQAAEENMEREELECIARKTE